MIPHISIQTISPKCSRRSAGVAEGSEVRGGPASTHRPRGLLGLAPSQGTGSRACHRLAWKGCLEGGRGQPGAPGSLPGGSLGLQRAPPLLSSPPVAWPTFSLLPSLAHLLLRRRDSQSVPSVGPESLLEACAMCVPSAASVKGAVVGVGRFAQGCALSRALPATPSRESCASTRRHKQNENKISAQ